MQETVGLKSGFNRIGIYYNMNFGVIIKNNQLEIGLKYYGPDKVFEKNTLGLTAGYSYLFSTDKIYCGPTLNYSFFSEKKSNSTLHLHELNIGNTLGFKLGNHFSVFSTIAIGIVLNSSKSDLATIEQNYINYEFALGLTYRFGLTDK